MDHTAKQKPDSREADQPRQVGLNLVGHSPRGRPVNFLDHDPVDAVTRNAAVAPHFRVAQFGTADRRDLIRALLDLDSTSVTVDSPLYERNPSDLFLSNMTHHSKDTHWIGYRVGKSSLPHFNDDSGGSPRLTERLLPGCERVE